MRVEKCVAPSAVLYGAGRIALQRFWDADPGASTLMNEITPLGFLGDVWRCCGFNGGKFSTGVGGE